MKSKTNFRIFFAAIGLALLTFFPVARGEQTINVTDDCPAPYTTEYCESNGSRAPASLPNQCAKTQDWIFTDYRTPSIFQDDSDQNSCVNTDVLTGSA